MTSKIYLSKTSLFLTLFFTFICCAQISAQAPDMSVKFVDLKATETNGYVLVQWTTNFEMNSKEFIIERSTEGTTFTSIGTVPATGTTTSTISYQFKDVTAITGTNFYRLKVVDVNDFSGNSKVVSLDIANIKAVPMSLALASYNNSHFQMTINSRSEKVVSLILSDGLGRVLHKSTIPLQIGANQISRMIPSSRGIYYASIIDAEGRLTKTIFNQ